MINVTHTRCRWTSQKGVEVVPVDYIKYPASQGWTDIRHFEIDLKAYEMDILIDPKKTIAQFAKESDAEILMNGTFSYDAHAVGYIVKDGVLFNKNTDSPQWIDFIIRNGKAEIGQLDPNNIADVERSFSSTPQIVRGGEIYINTHGEKTPPDVYEKRRPRTGLGIKKNGRLLGMVVDGDSPNYDAGLKVDELGAVMIHFGAWDANNLDGGGSSCLAQNGKMISGDKGERAQGAAITFKPRASMLEPRDETELVIDPGHGGKDPGGGSSIFWDPNGFYERDMALQISLYQRDRFNELGVPVALTRDRDIYLSPEDRTAIIKASGAKYCISNHINAASDTKARGVETIYSVFASNKIATTLLNAVVAVGMAIRRTFSKSQSDGKDWYFMHRLTGSVATTIIEYGFATNEIDNELIKKNWKVYAESVVKAWCGILGYNYTEPKQDIKPVPVPEPKPIEQVLYRLIVDGKRIGAYATEEYLFANVKVAIDNRASEIDIEKVVK